MRMDEEGWVLKDIQTSKEQIWVNVGQPDWATLHSIIFARHIFLPAFLPPDMGIDHCGKFVSQDIGRAISMLSMYLLLI
jgi:hypothetical protein